MSFIKLAKEDITKNLFSGMRYFVHHTYDYDNHCEFIHYNGTKYFADCHDEKIRKKLSEVFPVIENPFNSEDWFYYYMGLGGGLVFVHKKIAELFKQKIGKESLPCEDGPYDEEAMETIKEIYEIDLERSINYTHARDTIPKDWIYFGNEYERYFLGKPMSKNILILGINPSSAVPNKLDQTMKKVCKILDNNFNGYGWIMMNIFPQVTAKSKELQNISGFMQENIKMINFICQKFDIEKVWCMWGDSIDKKKFLRNSATEIFKILNEFNFSFVHYGDLTFKENPRHPLYVSLQEKFHPFLWQ